MNWLSERFYAKSGNPGASFSSEFPMTFRPACVRLPLSNCKATVSGLNPLEEEANALRKADAAPKKEAESEALAGRQRTQRQARRGGRAYRREVLRLEKQRQIDRQQEDIHPEHVQAKLNDLGQLKPPVSSPAPTSLEPLTLPEPDDELEKSPVIHLPMRRWNK